MLYLFAGVLFFVAVFLVGILLRRDAVKDYKLDEVEKKEDANSERLEARKVLKNKHREIEKEYEDSINSGTTIK